MQSVPIFPLRGYRAFDQGYAWSKQCAPPRSTARHPLRYEKREQKTKQFYPSLIVRFRGSGVRRRSQRSPLGASNALRPLRSARPPPPLRYEGTIGKEKQTTISCGKCSAFQTTHTTCSIMVAGCLRFVKGEVNA